MSAATTRPVLTEEQVDALIAAFVDIRSRFFNALIVGGTDPEFATIACERADKALAAARPPRATVPQAGEGT